jgi:hypothetical protein
MSFSAKEAMHQQQADEDHLYAIFFGHASMQPDIEKIYTHLMKLPLEKRYKDVLDKLHTSHNRMPKLAMILFALWLCPELKLEKGSNPAKAEPFLANIQRTCMDMLKGRHLSLQDFVVHTLTDYIVTPKA